MENFIEPATSAPLLLNLLPPSIRESLLTDEKFCASCGILQKVQLTIKDIGLSVDRSMFYDIIRKLYAENNKLIFKDITGKEWNVGFQINDSERYISISQNTTNYILPDYSALSFDRTERINGLNKIVYDFNLDKQIKEKWNSILLNSALANDEFDELHRDIQSSPVWIASKLESVIGYEITTLDSIIPNSVQYYKWLIGESEGSGDIVEYSNITVPGHIKQLISWKTFEGFLMALLMSSHSSIIVSIIEENFDEDELINIYAWLQANGDIISKVGAIEFGIPNLRRYPKIEPFVRHMIEQLRDDDPEDPESRFRLLSGLFMLVDGELCRTKILREKPPFWRRLAALSHASLLERVIIKSKLSISGFAEWGKESRSGLFYLQNMCDLRLEPRWFPDFVMPQQLKAELIGRIIQTANKYVSITKASSMDKLILGNESDSLMSIIQYPHAWFAGPLEGGIEAQFDPPDEILRIIEEELQADNISLSSLILIANSSLVFRVGLTQAQLAAKALRTAKYHLKNVKSKDILISVLRGLATVASVTRSVELASEIKLLIRKYRHETAECRIFPEDEVWIALASAAAHKVKNEWCNYLGEWITELSFQNLTKKDVLILHAQIEQLCHIVPELWSTCGRAEASLSSYLGH
ncbi:MAG: hypothetical protein ACM3QX_10680 [Syntrophomonadaceae bacterium]